MDRQYLYSECDAALSSNWSTFVAQLKETYHNSLSFLQHSPRNVDVRMFTELHCSIALLCICELTKSVVVAMFAQSDFSPLPNINAEIYFLTIRPIGLLIDDAKTVQKNTKNCRPD